MRANRNLEPNYIGMLFANEVDIVVNKIMDLFAKEIQKIDDRLDYLYDYWKY